MDIDNCLCNYTIISLMSGVIESVQMPKINYSDRENQEYKDEYDREYERTLEREYRELVNAVYKDIINENPDIDENELNDTVQSIVDSEWPLILEDIKNSFEEKYNKEINGISRWILEYFSIEFKTPSMLTEVSFNEGDYESELELDSVEIEVKMQTAQTIIELTHEGWAIGPLLIIDLP